MHIISLKYIMIMSVTESIQYAVFDMTDKHIRTQMPYT